MVSLEIGSRLLTAIGLGLIAWLVVAWWDFRARRRP